MSGYIKLYRKITKNWVWQEKPFSKGQAWIDILLECNHEDRDTPIGDITLRCNRGERLYSLDTWAKRWGWTKVNVRRFLDELKEEKMLTHLPTHHPTHPLTHLTTRITVCNYDEYQEKITPLDTPPDTPPDTPLCTLSIESSKEDSRSIEENKDFGRCFLTATEMKEKLLGMEAWKMKLITKYNCEQKEIDLRINDFFLDQDLREEKRTYRDFLNHFLNWLDLEQNRPPIKKRKWQIGDRDRLYRGEKLE